MVVQSSDIKMYLEDFVEANMDLAKQVKASGDLQLLEDQI